MQRNPVVESLLNKRANDMLTNDEVTALLRMHFRDDPFNKFFEFVPGEDRKIALARLKQVSDTALNRIAMLTHLGNNHYGYVVIDPKEKTIVIGEPMDNVIYSGEVERRAKELENQFHGFRVIRQSHHIQQPQDGASCGRLSPLIMHSLCTSPLPLADAIKLENIRLKSWFPKANETIGNVHRDRIFQETQKRLHEIRNETAIRREYEDNLKADVLRLLNSELGLEGNRLTNLRKYIVNEAPIPVLATIKKAFLTRDQNPEVNTSCQQFLKQIANVVVRAPIKVTAKSEAERFLQGQQARDNDMAGGREGLAAIQGFMANLPKNFITGANLEQVPPIQQAGIQRNPQAIKAPGVMIRVASNTGIKTTVGERYCQVFDVSSAAKTQFISVVVDDKKHHAHIIAPNGTQVDVIKKHLENNGYRVGVGQVEATTSLEQLEARSKDLMLSPVDLSSNLINVHPQVARDDIKFRVLEQRNKQPADNKHPGYMISVASNIYTANKDTGERYCQMVNLGSREHPQVIAIVVDDQKNNAHIIAPFGVNTDAMKHHLQNNGYKVSVGQVEKQVSLLSLENRAKDLMLSNVDLSNNHIDVQPHRARNEINFRRLDEHGEIKRNTHIAEEPPRSTRQP